MAKLTATKYTKPAPSEKPNPFVDAVKPYAEKGIDTAFAVEFTADEYKAEKLQIQKAANVHGVSAREVQTDYDETKTGDAPVKSTFVIRPARKSKGAPTPAEASQE